MSDYMHRILGTLRVGKNYRHRSVVIKTDDLHLLIEDHKHLQEKLKENQERFKENSEPDEANPPS